MNTRGFKDLVRECIKEILDEDVQRVCGWCGKDMGTTPGPHSGVSHGICPDCLAKQMADVKGLKKSNPPADPELDKWHMGLDNDRAMKQAGSKFV